MDFKILDDKTHILLRPNMYIGSVSLEDHSQFIDYSWQTVAYVPGMFKVVNELIDNSIDEHIRTDRKFADKIEIKIDTNTFWIKDNGRGIPVVLVPDLDGESIYMPVAAWCKTKSGSNFSDDENRVTIGMNGVGSALANIFSSDFVGITSDGKQQLTVRCSNNAVINDVSVVKSSKRFTEVTITPDFARFGATGFDDTMIKLIKTRLEYLSISHPTITFKFNGDTIKVGSAKSWVDRFNPINVVHSDDSIILGVMNSPAEEFRFLSLVNGLNISGGGSHIDYIMMQLCESLRERIKKKHKLDIAPGQIRGHIQLVSVIRNMTNMKFTSQTKEQISNTRAEISGLFGGVDFDKIAASILKIDEIINPIIQSQLDKLHAQEARDAAKKAKQLQSKTVAKHVPASSKYSNERVLFITEGDSAIGPLIKARDPKLHGGYPLRGKIPNICGMKHSEILKSGVLGDLINILGLKLGERAVNPTYGTIAIMTDQDVDGYSIRGLLINFFYLWPELFTLERIKIVQSPLYVATKKNDRRYFYSAAEFEKAKSKLNGFEIRYIKGLGSLRTIEYKDVIANPVMLTITIDDPKLLDTMYGEYREFGDMRKKLIAAV